MFFLHLRGAAPPTAAPSEDLTVITEAEDPARTHLTRAVLEDNHFY